MKTIFDTDELPQERSGPGCLWLLIGVVFGAVGGSILFHRAATADCPEPCCDLWSPHFCLKGFDFLITPVGALVGVGFGFGVAWAAWAIWQYLMDR
jgi:hypothetical protein